MLYALSLLVNFISILQIMSNNIILLPDGPGFVSAPKVTQFSFDFATFPYGVPGQVWNSILLYTYN